MVLEFFIKVLSSTLKSQFAKLRLYAFNLVLELRVLHNTVLKKEKTMATNMSQFPTLSKWFATRNDMETKLAEKKGMPKKWFYHRELPADWGDFLANLDKKASAEHLTEDEVLGLLYDKVMTFETRESQKGTGTRTAGSHKGVKLELTYAVTGEPKPFDKQIDLDNLKSMKAMAESMKMPFLYQPQLDKLEAEKTAFDKKYNSQLKLDKAKSANSIDYLTKIGTLIDNAKKGDAKVSELAAALDNLTENVINPLKEGTQEDKDNAKKYEHAVSVYRKYVEAYKELEKAIDKLENPATLDLGTEAIDLNENPEKGKEA